MDSRIFRHNSANQTISKFALTITIAGHWLTTRTLLYIRTHARARLQYPERHLCACFPFSVGQFHVSALLRIQSLILLCTDGKTSSRPPQAPPTNCPRIEKPPRLISQRSTRNKLLHAQKTISPQTYCPTNSLTPPIFVRFSA